MSSSRIDILLTWCNENDIEIDPRIQVVESRNHQEVTDCTYPLSAGRRFCSSSRDHGISVYSLEDHVDCSCVLVRIPKATILSTKSCFLSQDITSAPYGHTAHLALALALYGEILRGQDSRWFGYLQSLPRETVDLSIFWGVEDVIDFSSSVCSSRGCTTPSQSAAGYVGPTRSPMELPGHTPSLQLLDGKQARMWLSCIAADKELDGLMDEIRQYYVDVVEPTLRAAFCRPRQAEAEHDVESVPGEPSLPGFCHAYSLVSSRAFSVDLYHGLAMVPIADVFNHNNENHVHMESDFDVCIECGSLAECDHDNETTSAVGPGGVCSLPRSRQPGLDVDTLDMCTVKPISPHSEVFNTYGSLSNTELISRYGFALPENEHDVVRLGYGSFSTLINRLILVHSSTAGGNDADIYRYLQVRDANVPRDGRASSQEPVADDFARLFLQIYLRLAKMWTTEPRWDEMGDDGMVYNVVPISSPWSQREDPDSAIPEIFNINTEGKLTHTIWLFCVLFAACVCSPEIMTNLANSICASDDNPTLERFTENVKHDLLDVQDYIDHARKVTENDEDVSLSTPSGIRSDVRDDSNFIVTQGHIEPDTCETPVVVNEDHASVDSAFFVSSFHAPTCRSPSLDHALKLGTRPGEAGILAHEVATREPTPDFSGAPAVSPRAQPLPDVLSDPSIIPNAIVSRGLRSRRSSVEEERSQKRPRLSSPHAFGGEEDLPYDIFGRPMSRRIPGEDIARTGNSTSIAGHRTATHDHRALVAKTLARTVVHLCQHMIGSAHVSDGKALNGLTAAEIGELLDVTPSHMHRTRVAMELALSERSILESCAATWSTILENGSGYNK